MTPQYFHTIPSSCDEMVLKLNNSVADYTCTGITLPLLPLFVKKCRHASNDKIDKLTIWHTKQDKHSKCLEELATSVSWQVYTTDWRDDVYTVLVIFFEKLVPRGTNLSSQHMAYNRVPSLGTSLAPRLPCAMILSHRGHSTVSMWIY